ncbi:MAG TPA: protease complex subunit PrcB family protein [Elusimicrobiota bacterium]|nr:protease complex subunit PrcB family protein [Elusimicrobiota bacterium]
MPNEHIKDDIAAYLSGELDEARRREVDNHLADCAACRQSLNKARAKQARLKRQALKKAAGPDPVPNLLLARLGKQDGFDRKPRSSIGIWLAVLAVVALAYMYWHHRGNRSGSIGTTEVPAVTASSAPVAGAPPSSTGPASALSPSTTDTASALPPAPPPQAAPAKPIVPAPAPPPAGPPPGPWSGGDSPIKEARKVVIRNSTAWRSLWAEMGQTSPLPAMNFEDYVVVAVFAGEKPTAGFSVVIDLPKEDPNDMTVYYHVIEPAPESSPEPTLTHPWALRAVPRVSKHIHISQS